MKTSARNALSGRVAQIIPGAVNCEVQLEVSPKVRIVAIITRESVLHLGLEAGAPATAVVKSSFVILADADPSLRTSARNQIPGTVIRHQRGAVNDEVVLQIDEGQTITATITHQSAEDLGIKPGLALTALIKASHVILAVD
jgi:molybdate transport system regulatory protein